MFGFMNTIRKAIGKSNLLRTVVKSAPVQHVIVTARAAKLMKRPGRFIAAQATRRTYKHELATGQTVALRHRTRDPEILVEIYHREIYEPPPPLSGRLDGPLRVIDLGANIGLFSLWAMNRWHVRELIAYEPDPDNARMLRLVQNPCWTGYEAAAGDRVGQLQFTPGLYSESRAAREGEDSIVVPMLDVFEGGPCDLLKVDIEGGEWPILADPRLAGLARVMVMEWHGLQCPEPNAQECVHRLLHDAGFTYIYDVPGEWERNGLLWAWR